MKLNMWMIANRLENYEIDMQIEEEAEAVLNSPLPYYAPNGVCISAVGNDILCKSNQGYIRIYNISLSDGYLLIQNIFDWYKDLLSESNRAIKSGNFEKLAQIYQQAFGNPVMLQDSNYCLLGMSGPFGEKGISPEWAYIKKNGHNSAEGYKFMARALSFPVRIYEQNIRKFLGKPDSPVLDNGLHAKIAFQGYDYGKVTILESNRKMNYGDVCLLRCFSRYMAIWLAAVSSNSRKYLNTDILEALALGEEVDSDRVRYFQTIITDTRKGQFAVLSVDFSDQEQKNNLRILQLLKSIMYKQYPAISCDIIKDGLMILLFSQDIHVLAEQILQFFQERGYRNGLRAGLSCGFYELSELYFFFDQAVYAKNKSYENLVEFYNHAVEYLMQTTGKKQLCASEPILRHMWMQDDDRRAYLQTLKVYLGEERSSKRASEKMFIHKNTLTYRIKYLKDNTDWNLESAYIRDYLRLSIYVLEKSEKK